MRLSVSIVVMLVFGTMAAAIAAPDLKSDATDSSPAVDVELVIATDVSYSMDPKALAAQREAYAEAIVSQAFLKAIAAGPNKKIAITYFEWSAFRDQRLLVPWRLIDGLESASAVAAEIAKTPVRRGSTPLPLRLPFGQIADGCSEDIADTSRRAAALAAGLRLHPPKKVDPPGGTTGRVGFGTEVDEAPVPDANPREAFEVVWSEKPLLKQQPSQPKKSVTAGTHAAHVIAVSVELANPAAAAIAVIVTIAAGGDGGADDGGANEAGSDAPAERLGLRLGSGSDRAGNGKGSESESGELGLDRHGSLHPWVERPLWSACQLDGACQKAVRKPAWKYGFVIYFLDITGS
jgi:hypothetical protein